MRNKFAGHCMNCSKLVPAGEGHPHREHARWYVRCIPCVNAGRASKAEST